MDQKTWLWRKKSSEKSILETLEDAVLVPKEKEDLKNSLKTLHEELASVVDECSSKDKLLQNYKKTAQDAIADKEEKGRLKEELEQQKIASNEELAHLKDQLKSVGHGQDQMVMKMSREFEKSHKKLEEKLSSLTGENSYLSKALLVKEKVMEDLNAMKNETESELEALMARLDSVEKENAFLRYEFMSLEKELHIRNEELEYNRRSLEASKHSESGKKIKKLNRGNFGRNEDHTNKQLQALQKENRYFKECLAKKDGENNILALTLVDQKTETMMASEMRLMDDFVEMEKLAIVAVDSSASTLVNRSASKLIDLIGKLDDESFYKIHVFGWNNSEFAAVLQGFVASCNNLVDGKIDLEKFTGDLASVVGWVVDKSVYYNDHSGVRDEFKKHLGGDGPGTALELESVQNLMVEMEKMHSVFGAEIQGLKNKLKESSEDEIENLKMVNQDLGVKVSELVKKLSCVEVELENNKSRCQHCHQLRLQLESVRSNEHSDNKEGILQTGLEITKASAKLAECEETIEKLGKQLKTLGSAKELSVVDKAVDTSRKNKRSSLLDQMMCEDSPKTKEIISLVPASFSFPNARAGALVIVPTKKRAGGIGLLRKLLFRRKKNVYFAK